MAVEKTFVLVKPNGVERGLVGNIIARFEARELQLLGLKLVKVSKKLAREHYIEHKDRPFFGEIVDFITRSPVVAMVLEGEGAVGVVRTMMGTTNPVDAAPGTIRGDFALNMGENVIHGSDSVASAKREIKLYFASGELVKPTR